MKWYKSRFLFANYVYRKQCVTVKEMYIYAWRVYIYIYISLTVTNITKFGIKNIPKQLSDTLGQPQKTIKHTECIYFQKMPDEELTKPAIKVKALSL